MKNPILRAACTLALTLPATSCFSVDHFTGDATRFDGLYFGDNESAPIEPPLRDNKWRSYAVYGLVEWDEHETRFAGERLALVEAEQRPMEFAVVSEQTFLNGLVSFALGTLTGPLGALLYVPRSIEVTGWQGE